MRIWEQTAIISLYSINSLVCITETECVYCAVRTGSLYIIQVVCFVWIWEQTVIISLYSSNWLICITETECVYCAVRTECLNVTYFSTASFAWFSSRSKDSVPLLNLSSQVHEKRYRKLRVKHCDSGVMPFYFSFISNPLLCREMWVWHWKIRLYKIFRYFDEPALVKSGENSGEIQRLSIDGKGSSNVGSHKLFLEILVGLCKCEEVVPRIITQSL